MKRKIIKIDPTLCNGCGLCVNACHEGAIDLLDGKATLAREHYCDGLGDCLPVCPTGAISFEEREAPAYDEAAVKASQAASRQHGPSALCSCPGSAAKSMRRPHHPSTERYAPSGSQLAQWPCQIKLAPTGAPYFDNAHLLIAADCAAYAYAGFHERFMKGRITLIGCPKLDGVDYTEKLTEILQANPIESITVVRMEVPCCSGLERAVRQALTESGKQLPFEVVTLTTDGTILNQAL